MHGWHLSLGYPPSYGIICCLHNSQQQGSGSMAIWCEKLLKEDMAMVFPAWQMKGAC